MKWAKALAFSQSIDRRTLLVAASGAVVSGCNAEGAVIPTAARPALPGLTRRGSAVPGFAENQFRGAVNVLNMWASWCPYCRGEHKTLLEIAQDGRIALYGLLHSDKPEEGARYLRETGNPYKAVASDPDGLFARSLGQRGVPMTFVLNREGVVTKHIAGGLTRQRVESELMPAVKAARGG